MNKVSKNYGMGRLYFYYSLKPQNIFVMNILFKKSADTIYNNIVETSASSISTTKPDITYIPSLTPLRGIAAVIVLFFHFDGFISPLAPNDNFLMDKLYLMVDLFFVLSGFIMFHVYGTWFANTINKRDFFKYMRARFARLYPLHIFTFLCLFGVMLVFRAKVEEVPGIVNVVLDDSAIPYVLTLTQAWGSHIEATWNTASWSISVEWFLYLLMPFMVLFVTKYKQKALWSLGILSLVGLFLIMYVLEPAWVAEAAIGRGMDAEALAKIPQNSINVITGSALLRGFCGFTFGMIAYEFYRTNRFRVVFEPSVWFPLIWAVLGICWYQDLLPDAFALVLFAVLILHTAYNEGLVKRALNNRVLTYLGDISYSIYMIHIPMILIMFLVTMMNGGGPPEVGEGAQASETTINYLANWQGAIFFFGLAILVASFTYRFIEKPARKWLK